MADFCKQASMELFNDDYGDLANLCEEGQTVGVLCENCGNSIVDHTGVCLGGEFCRH